MTPSWTYTESYVKELYEAIGIFSPEQLDFQTIAHRLSANVFYWQETSQALFFNNRGYIMLDETLSPQQQWQDFCHELAHVLLHTGSQSRLPQSFVEYQEYKANHFMYHAAMPTFMLRELPLQDATTNNVRLVQQLFNVEQDFAEKRLTTYLERQRDMLNWNTYFYSR
ncbi:ImmA/IrrE family metallo-endopeptidase [Lysinibacillus sp. KU-BSD001]|uniref:ImmA/IrrE family metallo-endopeptidase n=1 Tax=Lysinibacillus sp. KU-BSD001 TaxID=3141328 RepID=UPI0036E42A59